uniref:Uncharacterized protein n=1 Tax=Kalanchoe fedtschenkoi TaxID=63787 RepID=A0A7N0V0T5_KALFE
MSNPTQQPSISQFPITKHHRNSVKNQHKNSKLYRITAIQSTPHIYTLHET